MSKTVRVNLGERSYDILIGSNLINSCGELISSRFKGVRTAIVTDSNVAKIHLKTVEDSLKQAGIDNTSIIVDAGEKSKSFPVLQKVVSDILDAKLERGDMVLALGGGVVGDLTGFAAGIVRRGMGFIQVPTSLLAQVDSSVGGKTGINTAHGKNLVGVFYQPELVLADTEVLDTLSKREFRAGYAEVVKYGLINQPDFFEWLEKNWQGVFAGGSERVSAIARSCQSKADVVARDERESGERALLNLGHTFGHALETATHYDSSRLVHGEGVAIGMVLAYEFSAKLNLCAPEVALRVRAHLKEVGLPTDLGDVAGGLPDAETLMGFIAQDKKVERGALTFILTRGLGQSFVAKNIATSDVLAFLQEKLAKI
ncbi:3-dehydroquinate synthase [Bartonella sp. HY329]|uniref:3-dehydroquinate synthase n=1 Tax=unclassified Bartonella TaxID=2645622 RepID=UPI0021C7D048|nr:MULTISPECIES: 3-dehydroquinate synthase [unclassified Bartonella]UXM95676.1 3-dehydroquinate synthase [Bartonella sp. HY329]UXN10001.1 3-dehydroquinate synthase [Bartonella sp. HY328]